MLMMHRPLAETDCERRLARSVAGDCPGDDLLETVPLSVWDDHNG
jgi:hypothetical protein